jgi:putative FmdB family regulatory protein
MPTYEYKCTNCGYRFEEFQSITDPPNETCPKCKGKTERIISGGTGFLLKGSGFYTTDHRSESYKKNETKERDEKSPPKKAEDKKETTKPKPKPKKDA